MGRIVTCAAIREERGTKSCGSGPEYGVTAGNGWGIEDGLKIGFSRFPFEYEMTARR